MDSGFSKHFLSNMRVKQGCPLSPTHFGLCIDKLEEVVNKVAREEGLNAPKLMQNVILLFRYADDVVLLSYDVDVISSLGWTPSMNLGAIGIKGRGTLRLFLNRDWVREQEIILAITNGGYCLLCAQLKLTITKRTKSGENNKSYILKRDSLSMLQYTALGRNRAM